MPITVPSLEDRREDITLLANYFVAYLNKSEGLPLRLISENAITKMQTMSWPGNIRQLRNAIEQVLILGPESLPVEISEIPDSRPVDTSRQISSGIEETIINLPLRDAREVFEREYLLAQINRFGGNISKTAIFVGMERSALHRKMKTLDIVSDIKSSKLME